MKLEYKAGYRVIYGDTDAMGIVYYGNYLRLFEIGRARLFTHLGLSYAEIEKNGYFLPVSEAFCRYFSPARYDDYLLIVTSLDLSVKGGVKFDYLILRDKTGEKIAAGHTRHAFVDSEGKVVKPPGFYRDFLKKITTD